MKLIENSPPGQILWQDLQKNFPKAREKELTAWLQATERSWYVQAQKDLAGWDPPHRAVAAVKLYMDFHLRSRQSSRIASENAMDLAPLPEALRPALPWGFFERLHELQFEFQIMDILRVLGVWSADSTAAVLSSLSKTPHDKALYSWLSKRPASDDVISALASGLSGSKKISTLCSDALTRHGERSVPELILSLSARSTATRRAASEILGKVGSARALAPLQTALATERSAKTIEAMTAAIEACSS